MGGLRVRGISNSIGWSEKVSLRKRHGHLDLWDKKKSARPLWGWHGHDSLCKVRQERGKTQTSDGTGWQESDQGLLFL